MIGKRRKSRHFNRRGLQGYWCFNGWRKVFAKMRDAKFAVVPQMLGCLLQQCLKFFLRGHDFWVTRVLMTC